MISRCPTLLVAPSHSPSHRPSCIVVCSGSIHDASYIMANNLHSRAAVPEHGQMAGGYAAGPPPSTLAAQLVENISASTKSSKSDENSELKGFFAIIQRVKDDPTLLKTPEDRVEHNHMLIYVYSRAVLEGIRLDDPFLDRAQVRTEALKQSIS
ncbi:hypothetical protein NXS19_005450 [Fusarium pseudograminearum]|nr:hypothetical protein NXS19_005450 [Fusarium pseudograminearum]